MRHDGTCVVIIVLSFAIFVPAGGATPERATGADLRPRLIVLTDIGGDPDDQQSMVRLMHYSNEFEIEGLIASAAGTPGELKQRRTNPQLIREIVEAYGKVRPNLVRHAEGLPRAEELLAKIKSGNSNRGRDAVGDGKDTEGSRWIIAAVDKADVRPLNIAIWGGQTDLAQALWRVRQERGAQGLREFVREFRVYDIADQDGIADWMWKEFPGMFYVLGNAPKGRDKREGAFRGMYLGGDESLVSRDWMETHIRQGHGPLGALYPPKTWTAPNPHSAIKEGDTPSWFFFLPNGVGDPEHPEWGGWGGRYEQSASDADGGRLFRDARDTVGKMVDARATVWRWRPAYQADFAARLEWDVAESYEKANHAPLAVLDGDHARRPIERRVRAGETVTLDSAGSRDPDGNNVTTHWWIYPEAGTFRGDVPLRTEGTTVTLTAPPVTQPQTIHVILQLRDDGTPSLFAFRRALITISP